MTQYVFLLHQFCLMPCCIGHSANVSCKMLAAKAYRKPYPSQSASLQQLVCKYAVLSACKFSGISIFLAISFKKHFVSHWREVFKPPFCRSTFTHVYAKVGKIGGEKRYLVRSYVVRWSIFTPPDHTHRRTTSLPAPHGTGPSHLSWGSLCSPQIFDSNYFYAPLHRGKWYFLHGAPS